MLQQESAQQPVPGGQERLQYVGTHMLARQNDNFVSPHDLPHPPQFWGSLLVFTHLPPQQVSEALHWQAKPPSRWICPGCVVAPQPATHRAAQRNRIALLIVRSLP